MSCVSNCNNCTSTPTNCGVDPCFIYSTTTDLVTYTGPNLPCIDVQTCETLTTVIEKIDSLLCGRNLAYVFINTILTNNDLFQILCEQIIKNCVDCNYVRACGP